MLLVGLTGGIGAGKSTVARLLAERGAVVLDADAIVRDLQQPGTDVYRRIVDRFGQAVVRDDGSLDRARIAEIVFGDQDALNDLNAIVHHEVYRVMAEEIDARKDTDAVIVLDVPLLAEAGGGDGMDLVVVVDADDETRVERVVRDRSTDPEDVRARIATQASSEQRAALADVVIHNDGSVEDLRPQVDELWDRITARRGAPA